VLARLKNLPRERQEAIAVEINYLLDDEAAGTLLTPEQQAEIERRLADSNTTYTPHEEVVAAFEKKYGR